MPCTEFFSFLLPYYNSNLLWVHINQNNKNSHILHSIFMWRRHSFMGIWRKKSSWNNQRSSRNLVRKILSADWRSHFMGLNNLPDNGTRDLIPIWFRLVIPIVSMIDAYMLKWLMKKSEKEIENMSKVPYASAVLHQARFGSCSKYCQQVLSASTWQTQVKCTGMQWSGYSYIWMELQDMGSCLRGNMGIIQW